MNFQKGKFFDEDRGGALDRRVGILVEGKDDAHLVDHLLQELGVDAENVKIVFCGGTGEMTNSIGNLVKSRPYVTKELQSFAVIRDCDIDPAKTKTDLDEGFLAAGLPVPGNAQIVEYDNGRRLGSFLIPSGEESGAVEDLLLQTIHEDEIYQSFLPPYQFASDAAGGLDRRSKRLMQIFLAVKSPLCKGGGIALKQGHFDASHAALQGLRDFLRRLTL